MQYAFSSFIKLDPRPPILSSTQTCPADQVSLMTPMAGVPPCKRQVA